MENYMEKMQQMQALYNYTRSLDALKASLTGGSKTVMLDKDSELARILYGDFEG